MNKRNHAGAAGPPSLPPPTPLFIPNVPGLVSTVMPTWAPQRTPETGDDGVAAHMPDLYQQLLLCHMMSFGMGNPARPSEISGRSPVSDTTGIPGSTCDGLVPPVMAWQLRENSAQGCICLESEVI